MSKTATLAQTIKVLTLIEQDGTPCEQLQQVLGSGLLSDLLHANFGLGVDRNEVRRALRLLPLVLEQEVPEADLFRETGELTIQIPALPRPTFEELRSKFDWIELIERDNSPIEAVTLKLATVLRESEKSINGGEYEKRIAGKLDIILGYQQAAWLVEHQDEFPGFMALLGKVYVDFTGLVVVNSNVNRRYPSLSQDVRRWCLYWDWFDLRFRSLGRVASSGK